MANVKRVLGIIVILALLLGSAAAAFTSASPTLAQDGDRESFTPELAEQLGEIYQQKQALTPVQRKIDSSILQVVRKVEERISALPEGERAKLADLSTPLLKIDDASNIEVKLTVTSLSDEQLQELEALGMQIGLTLPEYGIIEGSLPHSQVEAVAGLDFVVSVGTPGYPLHNTGDVTSAGDTVLRAAEARTAFGVDGSGVKVGVISDGVTHLSDSVATSDLPSSPAVDVLKAGSGDEGTAMLEIVHDLAPGSPLAFYGPGTSSDMVAGITALAAADCDIIVDDLIFFDEPKFEDGPIAQEARAFYTGGGVYVTSAGNSAEKHYMATYVRSAGSPGAGYPYAHVYSDTDIGNTFTVPDDGTIIAILQWNNQWGLSGDDFDLILARSSDGVILAASTNWQDGDGDPWEGRIWTNDTGSSLSVFILVAEYSLVTSPSSLILDYHVWYGSGLEYVTSANSVIGHSAVEEVLSTAAADEATPGTIESFSSRGPGTVYFPTYEEREVPNITGVDGVHTKTGQLGHFFDPFYGTSASAPHVAAIAALVWEADPTPTSSDVFNAITSTAVDLGSAGWDNTWGFGRVDAYEAVASVANTPPVLSSGQVSPTTGDVTTTFTYSVTYTDADDDPPTSITVSIDGAAAQQMTKKTGEDGDYTNGEVYEYTTSGLSKGSHTFQFAASDGVDAATGDTGVHTGPTVENTPPSVASVTITPDPAYTDTGLTATPSGWDDADGDTEGYQYQWQKWDGDSWEDIGGATTNTLDSSNFVKDDQIKVICTPFDGTDAGSPVEDDITISNSPPVLSDGGVSPSTGDVATTFTYSVTYTDADDDPPASPTVSIDGAAAQTMTKKTGEDGDYTNGEVYEYTTSGLSTGSHTFQFAANDGVDDATGDTGIHGGPGIENNPPVLSDGGVSPGTGDVATNFTYSVTYTDADNDAPMSITVIIDGGTPQDMTVKAGEDGDYTNGEVYEYATSGLVKDITHTFQFAASDGVDAATGDTGVHTGPTVENTPPSVASVTITPDPAYTDTGLTATPSGWDDADGDTEGYQYQWQKWDGDSWEDIGGATTNTLDSSNFVKDDQIKVICTPFDGTDTGSPVEDDITISNSPPIAPVVDVTPDLPLTSDDLVCTITTPSTDPDDDSVTYSYAWYKNDVLQGGLTTDTVDSANTAKGEVWKCVVTPNDATTDGLSGEGEVTIQNSPPTAPVVDVTPDLPLTSDDLVCSITTPSTDPDNDSVTYSYAWHKNDVLQGGLTTNTVDSANTAKGEVWKCVVTPNDATTDGPSGEDEVTIQNSPPSVASVSISPDPAYTNTDLTATPSGWSDPDGDLEGYQWQWQKLDGSWQNIPGANTNTLDSSNFVKDDQIKVICTSFDGTDTGSPVEDTITISNSPPVLSDGGVSPETGDMTTDFTYSVTYTDADDDPPASPTVSIDGAAAQTMTKKTGEDGDYTNGEVYEYTTSGLGTGSHTFQFAASDGVDDATGDTGIHGGPGIENTPPVLSDGGVSPGTGDVATTFTYSVTYTDADDDPPISITISIDGAAAQTMTKKTGEDGDYTNGEVYEYTTSGLSKDSHTFQFAASDGVDAATGDTGSHAGPTVQNSPPSVASVSISPDPAYINTDLTATPSGWSDPDGDLEGYQWQWQKWVSASWQDISGATTNTLDNTNFIKGDQIKVICTPFDGTDTGTSVEDTITISNSLPVANAGPDQKALINTPITLDGSDSSDADGDPLTYLWTQTGGISVPLSDSTAVNPTFTTPVADTYTFSLVVNDGTDDSLPDTVVITVKASNIAPVLSNGTVNPASGYTSTTFIYSVVYTDDDNDAPMSITVTIDGGTAQGMTVKAEEDGVYTNGEIYEYTATGAELGLGSHTFQFAASDGIDDATGDTGSHDGPTVSSPPAAPAGGGGIGVARIYTDTNLFGTEERFRIGRDGEIQKTIEATSEDGMLTITILEGTIALDEDGNPLSTLTVDVDLSPPSPPSHIIGLAYDFGPDRTTFDPPITLAWNYDPDALPEDVVEEDLVVECYPEEIGEWEECISSVDTITHTITVSVDHFTTFAIIARVPAAPPVPPEPPAAFTSSSLNISPLKVDIGETVTISVLVSNTGEEKGSYTITLKINRVVEATKEITLAGSASETVTFTTARDKAGAYSVDVDGRTGSFTVKEAVPPPEEEEVVPEAPAPEVKAMNWWLISGIIAAVVAALVYLFVRRRGKA